MGAGRAAVAVLAALLAGCQMPRGEAYALALHSAARGDLLDALARLDRIDPGHPRVTEARTLAVELRGRMARALDFLRHGIQSRGQGHEEESIDLFRRALAEWGECDAAHQMLRLPAVPEETGPVRSRPAVGAAAAARLLAMAKEPLPALYGPMLPPPLPLESPLAGPVARALATDTRPAQSRPFVEELASALSASPRPPAEDGGPAPAPAASRPVAPVRLLADILTQLEAARVANRLDRAAELLDQLPDRASADLVWRRGWAVRFDRRALLRYARGDVAGAVRDWEHALSLTPEDEAMASRLRAARQELR